MWTYTVLPQTFGVKVCFGWKAELSLNCAEYWQRTFSSSVLMEPHPTVSLPSTLKLTLLCMTVVFFPPIRLKLKYFVTKYSHSKTTVDLQYDNKTMLRPELMT